jgi:hypothetical protein
MADQDGTQYSAAYLAEDRRPALLSVAITFLVLSTSAVILRFVSRRIGRVGFQHDDIYIILGWIFYVALISVAIGTSPSSPSLSTEHSLDDVMQETCTMAA